jgi:DNA-binding MarR family transcriptional regulator/N-acetylglutamate synthase-like GNAT family acetyltransferase
MGILDCVNKRWHALIHGCERRFVDAATKGQVASVRQFSRFFTHRMGILEEGLLASPFTLAQARVLFELGTRRHPTAKDLIDTLGLDGGYLSRILQGFVKARLLATRQSAADARRTELSLTPKGRKAFVGLDRKSQRSVGDLLKPLSIAQRGRLLRAMRDVQNTMEGADPSHDPVIVVRPYGVGDVGWAIERHGQLYADEFGWNAEFEALVATLFAKFATQHQEGSEQFWIAEVDHQRAGCVFVVRSEKDPYSAQLRCLLVDPIARGLGVGRRLVDECIAFSRTAGYRRMILWTNDVLLSARRIYEAAGFSLIEESPHHSFGRDLVGQFWGRDL